MAGKMADASITVRLNTEGAEEKLTKIEKRTKKDEEKLKKADKKQKKKAQKAKGSVQKAKGQMMSPAMAGGIAGSIASAIPFGEAFMAGEAVLEFALPAMVETFSGILDDQLPDLPGFSDMKDTIVTGLQEGINSISEGLSWARAKIEALDSAKNGAMDVVRASTGLGIPIDADFLVDHTKNMFFIGEVQSQLRSTIKKAQAANMGDSLRKTIDAFIK